MAFVQGLAAIARDGKVRGSRRQAIAPRATDDPPRRPVPTARCRCCVNVSPYAGVDPSPARSYVTVSAAGPAGADARGKPPSTEARLPPSQQKGTSSAGNHFHARYESERPSPMDSVVMQIAADQGLAAEIREPARIGHFGVIWPAFGATILNEEGVSPSEPEY